MTGVKVRDMMPLARGLFARSTFFLVSQFRCQCSSYTHWKSRDNARILKSCEREVQEIISRGEPIGPMLGDMMPSLEVCSLALHFPCVPSSVPVWSSVAVEEVNDRRLDPRHVCCTCDRASPSLHASRAVTRLTVYRAHQVLHPFGL